MNARKMLPHEMLDDGFAPDPCEVLVIGCGNILRGDDAVGPVLVRQLWQDGVPAGVRLVDGGTAGMDVAFQMRGARQVVIVDASTTGSPPGTVMRVPAEQLDELPALDGMHTHSFRWDHALSFASWLLGPERPTDVTVFLIEAGDLTAGESLTPPVDAGMRQVTVLIRRDFFAPLVDITEGGYLHLQEALAEQYFPADVCAATTRGGMLYLMPLQSQANGGLLLKRRNAAGDRSLLVREVLADQFSAGTRRAHWDDSAGALVVGVGAGPGEWGPDR